MNFPHPTSESRAQFEAVRDKRIEEKVRRLNTFGIGIDPMTAIAVSLDCLVAYLVEIGVITEHGFNDRRLQMLEEMIDNQLQQLGKPKLHLVQ